MRNKKIYAIIIYLVLISFTTCSVLVIMKKINGHDYEMISGSNDYDNEINTCTAKPIIKLENIRNVYELEFGITFAEQSSGRLYINFSETQEGYLPCINVIEPGKYYPIRSHGSNIISIEYFWGIAYVLYGNGTIDRVSILHENPKKIVDFEKLQYDNITSLSYEIHPPLVVLYAIDENGNKHELTFGAH